VSGSDDKTIWVRTLDHLNWPRVFEAPLLCWGERSDAYGAKVLEKGRIKSMGWVG
jgi:hypothetical protein